MNALYLVGLLVLLIVLGYPSLILVVANKEHGTVRTTGRVLSGLFVLVLLPTIILYKAGVVQMPSLRLMPERPTTRMMRGTSAYLSGMMVEDERAIDEFITILKTNPEL